MKLNYISLLKTVTFLPARVGMMPRHIQLDVTTRCNLRCKMCFREQLIPADEINRDMHLDDFKRIIDTIRPVSVNMISGGEAFLNPEVFAMIKYAAEKNIQTILSSNFIVGKNIVEKVAGSGLDVLKISIDGAVKETYEKIRGTHFDRLIENIAYFNELKDARKKGGPGLRFDFVIQGDNYREIESYFDFAHRMKATSVYFHPIDARGLSPERIQEVVRRVDLEELHAILSSARSKAKKWGISTNIAALLRKFDLVRSLFLQENITLKRKPCLLPWLHLFVSINGETSPCCVIYPQKSVSYGNVFTTELGKIWNGAALVNDREKFKTLKNYDLYTTCRHCLPMEFDTLVEAALTFPKYIKRLFLGKRKE